MEYRKPIVVSNDDIAEVISAASGDDEGDCYTCDAYIHQRPETGRETYVIQGNARHDATHHSGGQELTIFFNQPVTFVKCTSANATFVSDGQSLVISYNYHANNTENHGLGEIEVTAGDGLAITGVVFKDVDKRPGNHSGC